MPFAIEVTRPNGKKFFQAMPAGVFVSEDRQEVDAMVTNLSSGTVFFPGTKYEVVEVKKATSRNSRHGKKPFSPIVKV